MSAALFPGQGVQAPGMDGGLADAQPDVFRVATDILGVDVVELCRTGSSGPASLDKTLWAQPAVLVCSVAAYRHLCSHEHSFSAVSGHSVGEYAALVACGSLPFEDALSLISQRARITSDIARSTDGAMAALLRIELEQALEVCAEYDVALSGDNAPGQCVISGDARRIERAIEAASGFRAMARRLDVEGAFHSPLMAPAAAALGDVLASIEIRPPTVAFWSSTTASRLTDPEAIRRSLVDQLTSCVRWRETVDAIAASGESDLVDVGPGRVVGALARRIAPGAEIRYAEDLHPAVAPS